jgi:hypothetical protein
MEFRRYVQQAHPVAGRMQDFPLERSVEYNESVALIGKDAEADVTLATGAGGPVGRCVADRPSLGEQARSAGPITGGRDRGVPARRKRVGRALVKRYFHNNMKP